KLWYNLTLTVVAVKSIFTIYFLEVNGFGFRKHQYSFTTFFMRDRIAKPFCSMNSGFINSDLI
ncbi:hypothetical protein A0J61_11011, partial [Choanephora cucurbitarum]